MGRRAKPIRRYRRLRLLLIAVAAVFLAVHTISAALRRANALGRRCSSELIDRNLSPRLRIAMVSFSSEGKASSRRSFKGVEEVVAGNKQAYATHMGYDLINADDLVDQTRPPAWSKILAVQSRLSSYDWIFWNDADTVVTNPAISLESVIWSVIGHTDFDESPDFILTEDINGVNLGVFFIRRSKWSENFLNIWWNQTTFISFGSTKSGDNAAFKHLIDNLPPDELRQHIRISPMQCLFNSYPWFPSWKSALRLFTSPSTTWKGVYSYGDFMVHLAGLDEKKAWAEKIVREVESN
ncbi:Glycosyltransferase 34 protein [Dioscorea alata]|uniref:Glycosyltransferase 34 protein n=1 Tax=Dioscorea alata TaxID=55571 RepID=A0ACB7WQI9_DIOAL|nr:Glycosyltransferase 34 protein [Dioscorea alata]